MQSVNSIALDDWSLDIQSGLVLHVGDAFFKAGGTHLQRIQSAHLKLCQQGWLFYKRVDECSKYQDGRQMEDEYSKYQDGWQMVDECS